MGFSNNSTKCIALKLLPEGSTTVIKKAGYPNLGKSSNSDHLLTILMSSASVLFSLWAMVPRKLTG
ncbi:hypothetical protein CFP56_011573 [Quercus suber]|uniref:Uncharacterized protein n=1 Tax=Quercus suber TaxID=58331 RepID=A0AAW0M6V7_QUESU